MAITGTPKAWLVRPLRVLPTPLPGLMPVSVSCMVVLMRAARRAYHLQRPEKLLRYLLKNLIYTLLFIFTIALSLFLVVISRKAMAFFGQYIPIPAALLALWPWLRYGIMALIMFFLLAALHVFAQDNHRSLKSIFPGVILSLAAWLFVSAAFSFNCSRTDRFSSLGPLLIMPSSIP